MSGATDAANQLVSGTPVLEGSGAMFARCFTGTWVSRIGLELASIAADADAALRKSGNASSAGPR
ncbi:MAG: hypothetical protein U0570_15725 [Phycisphaerales bacterium]